MLLSGWLATLACADLPVPPRVLDPQSTTEAWNVIRLATDNARRLFQEERLDEVAGQVSLCSPALRRLARSPVDATARTALDALTLRAFGQVNDVARHSTSGLPSAALPAFEALSETMRELQALFPDHETQAEIFVCPQHPDALSVHPSAPCPFCKGRMRIRRIPYTQLPDPAAPPATRLVLGEGPASSRPFLLVSLRGQVIPEAHFLPVHGAPVRFLAIDSTLTDFQSFLPVKPGTISFQPRGPGSYRIWAEVMQEETALPEVPWADWGGEFRPIPAGAPSHQAQVEGFQLALVLPGPLTARQTGMLRIRVQDASGTPVTRLEPFEDAFAHLTGLYEDGQTLLRLHPVGGDVLRPDLRGGPWLAFKMYPPAPGRIRLFCQVKIDGQLVTAPLSLEVLARNGDP